MSRGHGKTQTFVLDFLRRVDGGWMPLRDIAFAFAAFPDNPAEGARRSRRELMEAVGTQNIRPPYESVRRAVNRLDAEQLVLKRRQFEDPRVTEVALAPSDAQVKGELLQLALAATREEIASLEDESALRHIQILVQSGASMGDLLATVAHSSGMSLDVLRARITERVRSGLAEDDSMSDLYMQRHSTFLQESRPDATPDR